MRACVSGCLKFHIRHHNTDNVFADEFAEFSQHTCVELRFQVGVKCAVITAFFLTLAKTVFDAFVAVDKTKSVIHDVLVRHEVIGRQIVFVDLTPEEVGFFRNHRNEFLVSLFMNPESVIQEEIEKIHGGLHPLGSGMCMIRNLQIVQES